MRWTRIILPNENYIVSRADNKLQRLLSPLYAIGYNKILTIDVE